MRYVSIDILRTFAIVVMVFVHFAENLAGFEFPGAGFGAPIFALLSGVGYRLWLEGRRARGASQEEISKVSIRRGLFVLGVGFLFNVLVWLPEDTFNWDVLTLIGAALLILNGKRKWVGGSANRPLTAAVLIATMLFFGWMAWRSW